METLKKSPPLKENWNDQDRDNIYDLDHRIDRGTGRVLVRIAHRVAGHCSRVRGQTLPAVMSFLDIFFGVVPGATAAGHGDGHEQTGDNCSHQNSTQDDRAKLRNHRHQDDER